MGKGAPWILFLALLSVLVAISIESPQFLSDEGNAFLKDFLDNDILSVLGFITAVGNAATLSIFLHLNYLEDETNFKATRTRTSLRKSATSLVVVFLVSFLTVIIKPQLPDGESWSALANSIGIGCVVFALSVLRDLTLTVFAIPTKKTIKEHERGNRG